MKPPKPTPGKFNDTTIPTTLLNRARGMLVGLAIGDALGAPVQFGFDSEFIRKNIDTLRNLHDNSVLPKGVWTDDTSMALCIADSLLERGGYDSYDLMEKFCSWENLGYRSYFNFGYDVGLQVDRAICDYAKSPVVPKTQERSWKAGNGNIMRLAPIIIAAYNKTSENTKTNDASEINNEAASTNIKAETNTSANTAHTNNNTSTNFITNSETNTTDSPNLAHAVELAWLSGRETHYSEVAECGTEVFANLLYRALHLPVDTKASQTDKTSQTDQPNQIDEDNRTNEANQIDEADQTDPTSTDHQKFEITRLDNLYFTSDALRECWLDNSWLVENRIKSDGECLRDLGGYVMDALTIAIWGFLRAQDFESGMLEVLQLGGDTDTNCAIYGQLAGAYYGFSNIPKRWVKDLYLSDEIISLADRLAAMPSCPILTTRFEEDKNYFSPPT